MADFNIGPAGGLSSTAYLKRNPFESTCMGSDFLDELPTSYASRERHKIYLWMPYGVSCEFLGEVDYLDYGRRNTSASESQCETLRSQGSLGRWLE